MARNRGSAGVARGHEIPEEEALRAQFYGLLSRLLASPPSAETLSLVRRLDGDETEMGRALASLARVAAETRIEAVEREYNTLFIGLVRGELMPYGSHYLTGFLHERPLAEVRQDLERLGIARADAVSEPEDHIAILFEVMHGMITGAFAAPADLAAQRTFFDAHIRPWSSRFFADLEAAPSAAFYMPVGTVGRLFTAIEADAFAMAQDEATVPS